MDAVLALPELDASHLVVQVVVVDNGSKDGSDALLTGYISSQVDGSKVTLICAEHNRGYGAGNNIAIRYALVNQSPDYIWLLNNDAVPLAGSLEALLEAAEANPATVIWGSTLLESDGLTIQCAGGNYYNSWLGVTSRAFAGEPIDKVSRLILKRPLDYVCGAALFVRSELFRQIGLLEEQYFLFYEELDLARRLKPGQHLNWCPMSLVVHKSGASMPSEVAIYWSVRSLLLFTRCHFAYKLIVVLPVALVGRASVQLLRGHLSLAKQVFRGVFDGVFQRIDALGIS